MKKLVCLGLIVCTLIGLGSCGLLNDAKDKLDTMGSELSIDLQSGKLQDLLNQGLSGLEEMLGKDCIEATGEVKNNESGNMHVYDEKVVITVNTDGIRTKMDETGVTTETIKLERENAATAQMEYTLQYQYVVSMKINSKQKAAVCYATVTEDTLSNTVDITIPIANEEIGVTIYELLQGGTIKIESCLQHGTETTKSVTDTYYLNNVPEGKSGNTLTMQDHRNK